MVDPLEALAQCTGFQWDAGNAEKNWERHRVSRMECEGVFFNHPLLVATDEVHSAKEPRCFALGQIDLAPTSLCDLRDSGRVRTGDLRTGHEP
jgi:uncharacterized protein